MSDVNSTLLDREQIKKAITILKPEGQLFEVRIVSPKKRLSGYFTDVDTLMEAFNSVDLRNTNVYYALNFINPACYSRQQRNKFVQGANTTSDTDIVGYQWMLVDLDPIRPTDISSTTEELQAAANLAGDVYKYLQGIGFEEPVKALSGNGVHLLYRINMDNNEENAQLVNRCLTVLAEMFNNDKVKIDTVNYNPSRICKLYGTMAQKGSDTPERPFRMSKLISDSIDVKITKRTFLEKLCEQLPESPKPIHQTTYQPKEFDLEEFLSKNGITYKTTDKSGRDNSKIYCLDECVFDPSHKDGDAKIFAYPNGAISYKCHHNSCQKYSWQDVRRKFEPDAYDHKDIDKKYEEGWKRHNKEDFAPYINVCEDDEPLFRNAREIYEDDEPDHEFIKTGITLIDRQLHGLEKQCISLISGLRASGKSTILGTFILQAIEDNHTVVVYSGELSNKKYLSWLSRQAAGKNHIEVSTTYQNGVGVPKEITSKIVDWMGDKFWLYNNKFGNDFTKIYKKLEKIIVDRKADLCIIDNLMALDLSVYDKRDKYEAQTQFVLDLKKLAVETNTHIIVVAHPRKAEGFLRLDDVSGSGNIANAVDNAFMVHRVNLDFEKRFKETINKKGPSACGIDSLATNVVEIAKDRETGTMDFFIPLYFEKNSKRLMNLPNENVVYSWEDGLEPPRFYYTDDDVPF